MRVLYLMPQPQTPETLAAYSFLDEEVHALAASGVDAIVLSTAATEDHTVGSVKVCALPKSWPDRLQAIAFARMLAPLGRLDSLLQPKRIYHALRVEHYAAKLARKHDVDLIHSHFAWPKGFGGGLARAASRRPLVASLRGTDILKDEALDYGRRTDPFFASNVQTLLRVADRTLYFSNFMRTEGVALGAPSERARVVRKGVDVQRFYAAADRTALKRRLGFSDAPLVLTVAGLIKIKGVHVVLEALAALEQQEHVNLAICGIGPEQAHLEALAAERGIADRTHFLGRVPRDRIADYFAACDVFVLGSSSEAAGNVLFEAMAASRPIVCTAAGGPGEYVNDGDTGFVVPIGDDKAMAQRVGQLLQNPALGDRMGAAGRQRILTEFTYPAMIEGIKRVYREALDPEAGYVSPRSVEKAEHRSMAAGTSPSS
jgi:glycosyltransferase involved in cell wall biosynthesis